LTDRSIRHYLFQPRRQLTIWSDFDGGDPFLILQSPSPNLGNFPGRGPCSPPDVALPDELNGPFVEACDVVECKGVRSWWVRIRIVTYVNECGGQFSQNSANPISAHRWKRWVDTDEDYFATLVTEGEVVFRPSVMITKGTWPDQYRTNFFPPIDPTFRREKIEVIPSSDGTKVNYRVVDKELAFSIGQNCPATRVECFQTRGYSRGNLLSGLIGGLQALGNLRFGDMIAIPIESATPKIFDHVVVKAWANRNGSRWLCMQLAFGIAFQRIGELIQGALGMPLTAFEIICTQEITGKYVELLVTYRSGIEQYAIDMIHGGGGWAAFAGGAAIGDISSVFGPGPGNAVQGALNAFPGVRPFDQQYIVDEVANAFVDEDTWSGGIPIHNEPAIPATITQMPLQNAGPGYVFGNPPPPFSNASRGTWRGKLVAQALADPCGCQMPLGPSSSVTAPYVQNGNNNGNLTPDTTIYQANGVPQNPAQTQPDPIGF
jgi:hypothetical protein